MKTILSAWLLVSTLANAQQDLPDPKPLECALGRSVFKLDVIGQVDASDGDGHSHLEKRFPMKDYPGYTMIATSFIAGSKNGLADAVQIRIKNPQQADTRLGDAMVTVTGLSMAEVWIWLDGKLAAARCYVK